MGYMGCFEDLMQFRDEVDRAEKKMLLRSRRDRLKDPSNPEKEARDLLP